MDLRTFMIISPPFLLRVVNISDKSCRENQNTNFMLEIVFFFENRPIYGIIWKKKCGRFGQTTDENTTHGRCVLDN